MITAAPLRRLLIEKELTVRALAQLTGITEHTLFQMMKGKLITSRNVGIICSMLNCQPCDVIEYSKSVTKGHWVYIEEE